MRRGPLTARTSRPNTEPTSGSGGAIAAMIAIASLCVTGGIARAAEPGQWYRGDLHMHSNYSDGDGSVADVITTAETVGMDFIAITDHDTMMRGDPQTWFDPDFTSDSVTLLYGVEWSTKQGHANIWAAHAFEYDELWAANQTEDFPGAVLSAHEQGALISINHPTTIACCAWRYPQTIGADSVEVWNAIYRSPSLNNRAIRRFWGDMLKKGQHATAVGGSDTHIVLGDPSSYHNIGDPTTWVYATDSSPQSILDGLKAGRVTISYGPETPRLELDADTDGDGLADLWMGEEGVAGEPVTFRISLVTPEGGDCDRPALVGIFKNGHIMMTTELECGDGPYTFVDTPSASSHYRVQAASPDGQDVQAVQSGTVMAVSNPIYFQ